MINLYGQGCTEMLGSGYGGVSGLPKLPSMRMWRGIADPISKLALQPINLTFIGVSPVYQSRGPYKVIVRRVVKKVGI